ncbi:MAG: glycosyltransferase [Thermocladium sp.]
MVKASLIWLNYNSMGFMDIALKSIDSVLNLDFDGFEVIIVDNASTDGSFEVIRRFVEERRPSNVRVRFIRNEGNLGYAGGMNVGWDARDPDARYVAFLNNDLVAEPESLRKIIEHMESDEKVAAASGLIYHGDKKTIYSAGGWVDELWFFDGICNGLKIGECPGINKEHYVTYADGTYMVTKVDTIRRAMPHGKPFIDETFLYLDDSLLGLILWNNSYRSKYIPIIAGYHHASQTTGITNLSKSSLGFYYVSRGSAAFSKIVKTRYSYLRKLIILELLFASIILCKIIDGRFCFYIYGYKDGESLANLIARKIGVLSLYKAPYIRVDLLRLSSYIFAYGYTNQMLHQGKVHITHLFNDFSFGRET